jgi:hypothetical protein
VRRLAKLALSLPLIFGSAGLLLAQDDKKPDAPKTEAPKADAPKDAPKADAPKADDKKAEAPKADDKKADAAKPDAPKADAGKPEAPKAPVVAAPPALKPVPPEVQAKLEIARKAVAEAIAAAEAAGLVDTTIDPPPILDILFTGQANDVASLKSVTKDDPEAGVSPEVFGAWFTGYGKMEGIKADLNVRITPPSKGLSEFYKTRDTIMKPLLAEARKNAKPAAKPAEEPKKPEAEKPKETAEVKKPAEEKKPDVAAPKEEAKKPDAPKEEAKPAEKPKEEPKNR